jgi:uncharacterized protein (TIGR03437 family)
MIRGKFLCVRVLVLMAVAALSVYAQSSGVVVSSAGNVSAVAPGSLATMWGVQLGTGPLQAGSQAATDLGGFSVEVSGVPAQLLFVSSGQINFIVPSGTALGNAAVTVKSAGQVVGQGNATVLMLAPAIFVSNQAGVQMGAMLNAVTMTGDPFGPNTPSIFGCDKRTRIAVFGTGLGLSVPRVSAQDIQVEAQDSTGAIFSFPAESAGPAFGFTGLDQVNVTVPVGMASGRVNMRLVAGGSASNQASFDLTAGGGVPAAAACLAGIAAQAIPGVSRTPRRRRGEPGCDGGCEHAAHIADSGGPAVRAIPSQRHDVFGAAHASIHGVAQRRRSGGNCGSEQSGLAALRGIREVECERGGCGRRRERHGNADGSGAGGRNGGQSEQHESKRNCCEPGDGAGGADIRRLHGEHGRR